VLAGGVKNGSGFQSPHREKKGGTAGKTKKKRGFQNLRFLEVGKSGDPVCERGKVLTSRTR